MYLDKKRILITGGTGSLGKVLTRRILSGQLGTPQSVVVFSRDEAKQHEMRMEYLNRRSVTEDVMYHNFERTLQFKIGDVRDFHSVAQALTNVDIVFNAAALKQVPACEYFPYEAVRTNIEGAENIVRAIKELRLNIETVVAISTDKACKPTNVMGMTKAIQERIFLTANIDCPKTRFVAVRYGNVLASRGSVVPLFLDQIEAGGPITLTDKKMTRFLLTLDQAVDTVFEAMQFAEAGETYIPKIKAALIVDIVNALVGKKKIEVKETGVRPGEKLHEVLVSQEESLRTISRGDYFAIKSILPEVSKPVSPESFEFDELSSEHFLMTSKEVQTFLDKNLSGDLTGH
ncbi:MAG: polysaccharide biosynthesis protein [Ilumatobacteraceae bacterium]|jgi:UDP-glucose 4-epimerase|nr:polysaccharide biosynthesis protein [Ilumatobacteraceae bacterium]